MTDILKRCAFGTIIIMFLCVVVLCGNGACEDETVRVLKKGDETTATFVKNYACPVSDDEITEENCILVEYKGKVYNICCDACLKHFKRFPEKFATKANQK